MRVGWVFACVWGEDDGVEVRIGLEVGGVLLEAVLGWGCLLAALHFLSQARRGGFTADRMPIVLVLLEDRVRIIVILLTAKGFAWVSLGKEGLPGPPGGL